MLMKLQMRMQHLKEAEKLMMECAKRNNFEQYAEIKAGAKRFAKIQNWEKRKGVVGKNETEKIVKQKIKVICEEAATRS